MENFLSQEIYRTRTHKVKEDIRGDFFRDQTAIIHSMPFRRLKHKTQVFFAPENDHICTRIEHVMHVATIAKTICKGLNNYGWKLDVEMAFAAGLGHDLGHPPFGHEGEMIINEILGGKNAFVHEVNSYRVVQYLANAGDGLNLTYGVKDAIICHNGEKFEQKLIPQQTINDLDAIKNRKVQPSSLEACIVRFADKIAYLGRDIEDAIIAKFIKKDDIPIQIINTLGKTNSDIINTLVYDIVENSKYQDFIGFSDNIFENVVKLRNFNYKNIYYNDKKISFPFAKNILHTIFYHLLDIYTKYKYDTEFYAKSELKFVKHFGEHLQEMQDFYTKTNTEPTNIVTDFVAGMTDIYAINAIKQFYIPQPIV